MALQQLTALTRVSLRGDEMKRFVASAARAEKKNHAGFPAYSDVQPVLQRLNFVGTDARWR